MPHEPRGPLRLPGIDRADIPAEKLRDYLLNPEHPVGRDKARFFLGLGFRPERWAELHAALLAHAALGEARRLPMGPFGQKYIVHGTLRGPNGRSAALRAVWILRAGAAGPRFVTAYPEESR